MIFIKWKKSAFIVEVSHDMLSQGKELWIVIKNNCFLDSQMNKVVCIRIPETPTLCPLRHTFWWLHRHSCIQEMEGVSLHIPKTSIHLSTQSFKYLLNPSIRLSIHVPGKVLDTPRQVNKVGQQIQYQVLFLSCKIFFWKSHAEIFTRVSFQFSMKLVTLPCHSTKNHSFLSLPYLSNFNTNH